MNPQAFAQRLTRLADSVEDNVNALKQRVAKEIGRKVVPATPVDTSLHRSRWQAALNASPVAIYPAYFVGKHGSTAGPSTERAIQNIELVIDRAKPGDSIFIGNNGPAINRLNNGYSKQAPAGFVQMAMRNGVLQMRGVRVIRGG